MADKTATARQGPQGSIRAEPVAMTQAEGVSMLERRNTFEREQADLERMEVALVQEAIMVTRDAMRFYELADDAQAPTPEMIESLGEKEAWHTFRRMRAGQAKPNDAPSGSRFAAALATAVLRSREHKPDAPQMHVAIVKISEQTPKQYPTRIVEESK